MKNLICNDDAKNVGIKLSGGADSSIIYYAVAAYYAGRPDVNLYPMTLATTGKPGYIHFAKKVIEQVGKLTGKYPTEHFTKFIDDRAKGDDTLYVKGQQDLLAEVESKIDLDMLYQGLTANPKHSDMLAFLDENKHKFNLDMDRVNYHLNKRDASRDIDNPDRQSKVLRETPGGTPQNDPFLDGDKIQVYDAYVELDLLEDLYAITFSCEGQEPMEADADFDALTHCNNCFFCYERLYGFGRMI